MVGSIWSRAGRVVCLIAADLLAVTTAGLLAYLLWARSVLDQPSGLYLELLPLMTLFPIGFAASGLYPGFGLGAVETLRRLSRTTSLILVTMAALVFILKIQDAYSRVTLGLFWLGALALVPMARFALLSAARHWSWWQEPCFVVGIQERLESTLKILAGALTVGYRPAAISTVAPTLGDGELAAIGKEIEARSDLLTARGIRTAIVDVEAEVDHSLLRVLQPFFQHVIFVRTLAEMEIAEAKDLGGVFGLEFKNKLLRRRSRFVKRSLDVAVSAPGILATLPFVVAAVVAVKLVSPGLGFFRQIRLGRNGRAFSCWKIRTMVPNADTLLRESLSQDPVVRAEWKDGFKLRNDRRVIPIVGTFLRRFSIDELPQLWNVLKGDMSLVGPRPLPRYHLRGVGREQRVVRQRVRPGMTGLWQLEASQDGRLQTLGRRDEYYVRNWSIWLDAYVLAKTAIVVVRGSRNSRVNR